MFKTIKIYALALIVALFSLSGQAFADDAIYTGTFSNKAVKGYDTVSYFQGDGLPVKGSEEFQTEWQGADWYFSSKENLDKFKSNPERYAPQYGGYCAFGVTKGKKFVGDPLVYRLVDGKLYLNLASNVQNIWVKDIPGNITTADGIWPSIKDKHAADL